MLYLVLAICSSALVSIFMRVSERYVRSNMVMFSANYAVCTAVSLLYAGGLQSPDAGGGAPVAIALGSVTGVLYLAAFVLLQKSVSTNGVILSGTAMKLGGVLIPVLTAMALFGERLGWVQAAGIAVAIVAIVLVNWEKAEPTRESRAEEPFANSGSCSCCWQAALPTRWPTSTTRRARRRSKTCTWSAPSLWRCWWRWCC